MLPDDISILWTVAQCIIGYAQETRRKFELKGLEIAKEFFFEWGYPFFKENFPQIADRMAVGRLGGSDVIGADDEISRDHNWGPQFTLFLSAEDYAEYGEALTINANKAAPAHWKGYRVAGAGDRNVDVESIPEWFARNFGITAPPKTYDEWTSLLENESPLYFLRHGAIWIDGFGELSGWRETLHHWPEHILTKRLMDECFRIWHHGEYNFVQRMTKRRDSLAISICLGEFISGVMRILFLLNGDYAPYWKWLSHEFRKQHEADIYLPLMEKLVGSSNIDEQARIIQDICDRVHRQLLSSGHVCGEGSKFYLLPLLNDYNELRAKLNRYTL